MEIRTLLRIAECEQLLAHSSWRDPMVRETSIFVFKAYGWPHCWSFVNGVDAFNALLPKLSVMTTARDRRMVIARVSPGGLKILPPSQPTSTGGTSIAIGHLGMDPLSAVTELLSGARAKTSQIFAS